MVDDTRENLRLLSGILAAQGHKVRPVTNGPRALAAAQAEPPDLILLDIRMPDMDGYAVCAALKADETTSHIPVIFISALSEVFDKVRAFEVGGIDYITKPFQVEEVLARVQTHLHLYTMQRQLAEQNSRLEHEIVERRRIEHRLNDELRIARDVQQSLLPAESPNWASLEVVCYSLPAQEVGGDHYVYHELPVPATQKNDAADSEHQQQRYAVGLGDVSGKGMPAALLMSASMASFRTLVTLGLSPGEFLAMMDAAIMEHTRSTRQNCALAYLECTIYGSRAELSPAPTSNTDRLRLRKPYGVLAAANAGAIPPILKRADGFVEWLPVEGMPLGVGLGGKTGYQDVCRDLGAGDMIILVSDGVLEAKSAAGSMFGFDRLEHTVRLGPASSAASMLAHLRSAVEGFVGDAPLADDMTIVVVRV